MHRLIFVAKAWGVLFVFAMFLILLLLTFQSCSNSQDVIEEQEEQRTAGLTLNTKAVPMEMINNALLYRFDTNDKFMGRQLNVTNPSTDVLYTNSAPTGTWNYVLLMCKTNLLDKIINPLSPYVDGGRTNDKMWETATSGGYLLQTPELYHVYMPNVTIVDGVDTQVGTVTPRHNVSMVRFTMEDRYTGFDAITSTSNPLAFVELYDVPTSLRWDGGLYPSHTAPTLSTVPMREYFEFDSSTPKRKAKKVEFIIPAHLSTTEVTTNKLKFKVSMPLGNASYYGKTTTPMEVGFYPKANKIIQIDLTFAGEPEIGLDINLTVKDWETEIDQSEDL